MKRYSSTPIFKRWDGKQVYKTTQYPVILPSNSDMIIISNETSTLDGLAYKYYNDPTLWWVIALINNIGKGRLSIPCGIQLRIPSNINDIISQFNNLNQSS